MNSLFVNLQRIINSILSKYLRFIVKKNICQYIYLWLKFFVLIEVLSVWCLRLLQFAIFFYENWIFLEDKVLIGGGIDHGLARWAAHVVGLVGGEGGHLLDPALLWGWGYGGGGVRRGGRRSQRANHIFPVLPVKHLKRMFLHFGGQIKSTFADIRTTFNSVAIIVSMVWME